MSKGVSSSNDTRTHNYIHNNYKRLQEKTENPRVSGSIPLRATSKKPLYQ